MAGLPEHHRQIARHVAAAWTPDVGIKIWSAEGTDARQAIASLAGWPQPDVTVYSTVGLCDYGGYEIVAAASSRLNSFVKALFDLASFAIDGNRLCQPGELFPKALRQYYSKSEAGHLVLRPHPPAELGLDQMETDIGTLRWLHAAPVTSDELILAQNDGFDALDAHLTAADWTALVDLDRPTLPGVPAFDP